MVYSRAVQRARTQLPIVWLHGVRIDAVADISDELLLSSSSSSVGTIPIRYVLECSVDNGTKMLEVPLFSLPQEVLKNFFASSSKKRQRLMQEIETSCDILQDLSSQGTNYNIATSASFISLSLYLRYSKSSIFVTTATAGSSNYNKPKLLVSNMFLHALVEKQQKQDKGGASYATRYCWMEESTAVVDDDNNNMDRIIKNNGLSQYRTMKQILDENRSVFDHNISINQRGYDSDDSDNTTNNNSKKNKSISLTLEQQSKLKLLQSAYKIAIQKEDNGALRRIRTAMDELENDVMEKMMKQKVTNNNEDIDSGLSSIRCAMKISNDEENNTVDLLSELEKAVILSSSSSSSSSSRLTTSAGSTTTTMMQSKIVIKTGPFGQPAKSKEEDLELTTQIILDYVNSQMVDAGICDDNDYD